MHFPSHTYGLYLEHNVHRDMEQSLQDWLNDIHADGYFASQEALERSLSTDECWSLEWYPETPLDVYRVMAPTLQEVLALAMAYERTETREP